MAGDLHRRAVDLVNYGRYAEARRLLITAIDRADDVDLRARAMGTLAYVMARTGEPSAAEQVCHEALALPGISRESTAVLYGQLGAVAQMTGLLSEAESWLTRAIASVEDSTLVALRMHVTRSLVRMQNLRLDEAAQDTELARRGYAEAGLTVEEAQMRHNLGYINLLRGDLVGALSDMETARRELRGVSAIAVATCDVDRAEVLRDAGLTTEAERILVRNTAVFGAHRMPQSRAEAELNLARSMLTHDPVGARRIATAAGRRLKALGNEAGSSRAEGIRLRAELSGGQVRRGGYRAAAPRRVPTLEEVTEVASALRAFGFHNESAALRLTHELWRARDGSVRAKSSRVSVPSTAPIELRLLASEVKAARSEARRRHLDVRRHAARGLDDLMRWQSSFGSLDLQTSIVMHGNGLIGAGLASAVQSGRPDVVFEWSERARHLSLQVVPLRPPPNPSLAEELAELRMLRAENEDWYADPRVEQLRERARERQWSATGTAEIQERVTMDEARAALDTDTAALSYVFSGDRLSVLLLTRDHSELMPLPGWPKLQRALPGLRADLDMAASVRGGPLAEIVRAALDERLATLSSALLTAPLRLTSARRIVVTAPGVLSGIPWAMLPGMRGRAFTLAASATQWVRLRGSGLSGRRAGFAVGPRVPRGHEEAALAASAWTEATTLLGTSATVEAVTDLASRLDVLHIAAHGRHAVDNPLFSGLELADGTLFGYDIDLIPSVPETVVLSACEVGRSSVRWGEEAIGMTRIWLHAGTRCVIAAPVVVADDMACELLGAMHEGLAAGEPPSVALATASELTGIIAPFQAHGSGF